MTKTKTILTALALTTALTAPVLVVPMLTAPPAIAGQAAVQDLSDLAAKVTPAVVNVAVTMKAGAADDDETQMSDRSQQQQMEEFMQRFAERFGQQGQPGGKPQMKPQQRQAQKAQAVGTGFIVDANGWIVTNFHVAGNTTRIDCTLTDGRVVAATVVAHDPLTDLSVLRLAGRPGETFPHADFGDSDALRVGERHPQHLELLDGGLEHAGGRPLEPHVDATNGAIGGGLEARSIHHRGDGCGARTVDRRTAL